MGERLAEFRLARQVDAAAYRVHGQARDAQLLVAGAVDPDHLGDRRRLAQELQVFDATLLERVAALGARQRRPAHLVLDVEHVLLDPGRRALGLLDLQRSQVGFGLAPGEVDANGAARDQHSADQRDDQQRVFRKETPAPGHSTTRSARSSSDFGTVMPSARATFRLTVRSSLLGCSIGRSPARAPLRMRSTWVAARRRRSLMSAP